MTKPPRVEVCILAGGLSTRMGRDKARLRLGRRTMLAVIRAVAKQTNLPVRIIRRDVVPRCGPLGGVYTALKTTSADAILFLACDMPFVTTELLDLVLRHALRRAASIPVFTRSGSQIGFPFLFPKTATNKVLAHLSLSTPNRSLKSLCRALHAKVLTIPSNFKPQLQNINTPEDLQLAKKHVLV